MNYDIICTALYTEVLEKAEHIVDEGKKHEVMDRANEILFERVNEKGKEELEQLLIDIPRYLQSLHLERNLDKCAHNILF